MGVASQLWSIDGKEDPHLMHGRGIVVNAGRFVVFSRIRVGKWIGIDAGECVANKWRQIAFTQENSKVTAFLDGNITSTVELDGNQGSYYPPKYSIGSLGSGVISSDILSFKGDVGLIRIWSTVRTQDNINCGDRAVAIDDSGLIAGIRFKQSACKLLCV